MIFKFIQDISDHYKGLLIMGNDCMGKRADVAGSHPATSHKYKVLIICGSLRQKSTNRGLLNAIVETKHPYFEFTWADILNFPVFDEDVQAIGLPSDVKLVRRQAFNSDAILFGIPQYNFSIAAPLKNAYDWLSREYPTSTDPVDKVSPVQDKLGAMVSVGGNMGGGRAQDHFLQSVQFKKMKILPPTGNSQLRIQRWGGSYFNDDGVLINNEVRAKLTPFLDAFAAFISANLARK